jgi:hypothetical protein
VSDACHSSKMGEATIMIAPSLFHRACDFAYRHMI